MSVRILVGDCLERLRDYGVEGAIGLEPTFGEHINTIVTVFREVRRVLRSDGTLWLNYGDCYHNGDSLSGLKPKDLVMMPARVALALQADGWWLRSEIVWHKPNPMPESVRDRPTSAHEKIYLLTKSARYFYDAEAVRTKTDRPRAYSHRDNPHNQPHAWETSPTYHARHPGGHSRRHAGFNDRWDALSKEEQQASGSNLRNVWTIATHPFPGVHFATFPPKLVEPCIKAGTSERGPCPECGMPWVRGMEVHDPDGRLGRSWHDDDPKERLAIWAKGHA